MKSNNEEKLKKLKSLIYDYSFQEKKTFENLVEIDTLMRWALKKKIKHGMTITEVEKLIGTPSVAVGEGMDNDIEWLYPCLPDESDKPVQRFGWFWQLSFKFQKLETIKKTKWLLGK